MTEGVDATTIGAFVTIILAFLGVAKIMLNQATKDRDADREERIRLAHAIEKMAENSGKVAEKMGKVAEYTKEGNVQSAQRNGHLGELIIESGKQTEKLADMAVSKIIEGVLHVETQHVHDQKIDKSTVKNEIIENETVKKGK